MGKIIIFCPTLNQNNYGTGIIKTDISDQFPISLISNKKILENAKHIIRKRVINEESILYFKEIL